MDASGTAITSLRTLGTTTGDSLGSDRTLEFTPSSPATVADPVVVPCSVPSGSDLLYGLKGQTYTADPIDFNLTAALNFVVDLPWPIPDYVDTLYSKTYSEAFPPLNATANDIVHDLGPIQADNRPPMIGAISAPSGTEGTPIQFGVVATDNCGTPTVRWDFSDGGVAFGLNPYHTFSDNGTYSGLITATDQTGNTATQTFSVTVDNVAPTVSGGPDKFTPWGIPVSFHANGSDPGSIDNTSLLYAWDFADPNSPIGASGQNVSHTYSQTGTYNAQVTVTDKDTASGADQVLVTVGKRATTTAYTGPLSALPSKNVTLAASVVDQYGQPVVGRTVAFTLGTQSISATTDAAGNASATIKLNQKKGSYTVSASFAGDGMYLLSSNSRNFTIG
jgi:PKD repeat protein